MTSPFRSPQVGERVMLVRDRLLERLGARWSVPVTVVVAPAGYGKTTLLAQAVAANEAAPVGIDHRLSCGPDATTASALGEALGRAVGAHPARSGHAGQAGGLDELVGAIVEAVWQRSPQQVALIVDDVHEIPPDSEAAHLLAQVVGSLPMNGHVVLAGRQPPPVPLARREVEGRVARLDEDDLAFTDEEAAAFATLRGVPASQVVGAGGWPALAELSASAPPKVTDDYVGQEVLAHLSPAQRRDLAVLAHVGPFDDDLAGAVLGTGASVGAASLLAGLPLVTVHATGERSLHWLWRRLLADEATAADVAQGRRRAAGFSLRRGDVATAVRLLFEAEAWDELGEAIVEAVRAARVPVQHDVLTDWLVRLPPPVRDHPGGRLLAAVVARTTDPEGAWRTFEECAAAFAALGHRTGELACHVHLAELAWWSEHPERLVAIVERLFELEAEGLEEAVALACLARALLFDIQSDSQRTLLEIDRIPPGSLSPGWQSVVGALRSSALLELGHAGEALTTADDALAKAPSVYASVVEGVRMQALWYQGRIGEVLDALPDVLGRVQEGGHRQQLALAAAQCAVAHALRERRDEAASYLAQAKVTVASPVAPLAETTLAVAEAVVAVADGDEAAAGARLADDLARHPLLEGLSAAPHLRSLALIYVLVPATRERWEGAELGPLHAVARDLARTLAIVRDEGRFPSARPELPDAAVVAAHLPLRWLAELGVAAVAAGREDGHRLLEASWPATRATVVALAEPRGGPRGGPLSKAARTVLGQLAVPPTHRFELRLLGPVELHRDGVPVQAREWRRERVRSLLAYLALQGTVSREQAADDLWPALDVERQAGNLRVTLSYLLRVLEPERGPRDASFFVRQEGDHLTLEPGEWLEVDVWDFDVACDRAADADRRSTPSATLTHALRAVELWRGEDTRLAAEPWAVPLLEQRRIRYAGVAVRAGELLLARGNLEQAQALADGALALDPWLDAAHRLVVAAHRAAGDASAARRALARYRDAVTELGVSPDETIRMIARLLDSHPLDGPAPGPGPGARPELDTTSDPARPHSDLRKR